MTGNLTSEVIAQSWPYLVIGKDCNATPSPPLKRLDGRFMMFYLPRRFESAIQIPRRTFSSSLTTLASSKQHSFATMDAETLDAVDCGIFGPRKEAPALSLKVPLADMCVHEKQHVQEELGSVCTLNGGLFPCTNSTLSAYINSIQYGFRALASKSSDNSCLPTEDSTFLSGSRVCMM
ncbi:hypothetical protein BC830DRAFT_1124216 [Chytriomyces sp. MP71]|nr:hypothetical protein BC830DRAFT_1124216 [Chytriomyces sp. MP71]